MLWASSQPHIEDAEFAISAPLANTRTALTASRTATSSVTSADRAIAADWPRDLISSATLPPADPSREQANGLPVSGQSTGDHRTDAPGSAGDNRDPARQDLRQWLGQRLSRLRHLRPQAPRWTAPAAAAAVAIARSRKPLTSLVVRVRSGARKTRR
jgi:hypothetical protein